MSSYRSAVRTELGLHGSQVATVLSPRNGTAAVPGLAQRGETAEMCQAWRLPASRSQVFPVSSSNSKISPALPPPGFSTERPLGLLRSAARMHPTWHPTSWTRKWPLWLSHPESPRCIQLQAHSSTPPKNGQPGAGWSGLCCLPGDGHCHCGPRPDRHSQDG